MNWAIISIKKYTSYQVEYKAPSNNNEVNNVLKYKAYPVKGEHIGTISIPILNKTFPIIEGTSNNELKHGVGHYIESVLPGVKNNSVLSAHRDTLFAEIGKLKIGDSIIINMDNQEYIYEVINTKIVKKDDRTVIVPTEEAILTLTTCYPFNFIGLSPDRYIISSILINR
ncbi:MAG: class D sortase [Tenericutes bacterium]|nr:class D sortase [Mycoplasmatota bacterium]